MNNTVVPINQHKVIYITRFKIILYTCGSTLHPMFIVKCEFSALKDKPDKFIVVWTDFPFCGVSYQVLSSDIKYYHSMVSIKILYIGKYPVY